MKRPLPKALLLAVALTACSSQPADLPTADGTDAANEGTSLSAQDSSEPTRTSSTQCLSDAECRQTSLAPCERLRCLGGECVVEALPDLSPCNDGNPCTSATHCLNGQCSAGTVDFCFDDNPCTTDVCDPVSGCEHEALGDGSLCDDHDPCTLNDQCIQGLCVGLEDQACLCSEDSDCAHREDGNLCNGTLTCVEGACRLDPNTVVQCAPPETCEVVACIPTTGLCVASKAPNGALCDDANPCSVDDACDEGTCVGSELGCSCEVNEDCAVVQDETYDLCQGPLVCVAGFCQPDSTKATLCPVDENPEDCLAKGCHPVTGLCGVASLPDGVACRSEVPCTADGVCAAGVCVTPPPSCEDNNPCTLDVCDEISGCIHTPLEDAECDDEDPCTSDSICEDGACIAGTTLVCDDGNPCTADQCVAGASGCEAIELVDGSPCDGSDPCQVAGICVAGACMETIPKVCETLSDCQTATCIPGEGCIITAADDGLVCEDGDPCTELQGVCEEGSCVSAPLPCSDDNPCTSDSCGAEGCSFEFVTDTTPCTLEDLCVTKAACQGGVCVAEQTTTCTDTDCLVTTCDPATGDCSVDTAVNQGAACGVDDACHSPGTCSDGLCLGAIVVDCDDEDPCTVDSCSVEDDGQCNHVPLMCAPTQHTPCALPQCAAQLGCNLESIPGCELDALIWSTDFECATASDWTFIEGSEASLSIEDGPADVGKLDGGCEMWLTVSESAAATTSSWTVSAQSPAFSVQQDGDGVGPNVIIRFWSKWWWVEDASPENSERRVQLLDEDGGVLASAPVPDPIEGWNATSGTWTPIEVTLPSSDAGQVRLGFVFTSKPSDTPSELTWVIDQLSVHPANGDAE